MAYALPAEPTSGIGVDANGITWRRNTTGGYDADPCPTCGARPAGPLSWPDLLSQRGPISDAAV